MTGASWSTDVFERLYRNDADPWDFVHSPYEAGKLARMLAMLPPSPSGRLLELGCAIGVGTRALAARARAVTAIDASATALARARARCAGHANIRFIEAFLPRDFPDAVGAFDGAIVSELLYFLSADDIARLAGQVMAALAPRAFVMIVNWTGPTDTPCTGHQAARLFIGACLARGAWCDRADIHPSYRIDRLQLP